MSYTVHQLDGQAAAAANQHILLIFPRADLTDKDVLLIRRSDEVGADLYFAAVRKIQMAGRDTLWVSELCGVRAGWANNFLPVYAALEVYAKQKGCEAVAATTKRRGMMVKMIEAGFRPAEWILQKMIEQP